MEHFTEQAYTYSACIEKIRKKYGNRANILVHKTIRMGGILGFFSREGVEMSGTVSHDPVRTVSENDAFPLTGVSSLPGAAPRSGFPSRAEPPRLPMDFETERKRILASVSPKVDPTLQLVLSEVRTIKEQIANTSGPYAAVSGAEHPSISRIQEILHKNDFTPQYTGNIIDRIRKEFALDGLEDFTALQDTVVEWIGESIALYKEEKLRRHPRIMVLVGPTGVGKTTTIAKLAAIYGTGFIGRQPLSVLLVTIDNYRIGASYQIEKYGDIMEIPVSSVKNHRDLEQVIALHEGIDLILIDTIGKNPRASVELAEMKHLLDACGSSAEFHLTVAATTKSSDISEILMQYEPFGYRSVIVTKIDETIRVGNVISALSDRGKPISFITEGQQVPKDIQKADVVRFLTNLEGFKINRAKIEERFPCKKTDYIQWRE
ncbi:MAG: flagellar biosynthesis protein FlhF [Spirochaetaceae bacterium]|jgi:flagellar biosynthesis protein FlhF|nr:flagellar biosynthesis protein FlhF [Spirochaetaceae bacterium]